MKRLAALVWLAGLALSGPALAGKIVVNHDEWTLSNTGFANATAGNAATFATNIASFFTGGGTGSFLAYSANMGLNQSALDTAMTGAGHTWTVDPTATFDLATLLTFDGVFVGGQVSGAYPDNGVLIDYVNAGGNVYVMGGTGNGGFAAEAAGWNAFLNAFGLAYDGSNYNGVGGTLAISSGHPIFNGVSDLYQNNGNTVIDIDLADTRGVVLENGLYAVYDDGGVVSPVPEPTTLLLLGLGLAGLGWMRRNARIAWTR